MIVTKKTPALNLHEEVTAMAEVLVNEFINDNVKMKNDIVTIIHGKSTNIMTKEVHRILKENKNVEEFKLDNWNLGRTIVKLKI